MNKTKRDLAIESGIELFKDRIDVDCKHGSGFFKEHINNDGSVERLPFGWISHNYWRVKINGTSVLAHRLMWSVVNGPIGKDVIINHKDNNPNNNHISNLEIVDCSRNAKNRLKQSNNKSGVPGVSLVNNKWVVTMTCTGVQFMAATVDSFEKARIIRDRFFIKSIIEGDPNIKDESIKLSFISECYSASIREKVEPVIEKYGHLIYSTVDEICGEKYEFKRRKLKANYNKSIIWKPDNNSPRNLQIYSKVLEIFEYNDELGLYYKNNNKIVNNTVTIHGYIKCNLSGTPLLVHHAVWMLNNGPIPDGNVIDHIDGNSTNNRIENLQLTTARNNSRKRTKRVGSASKFIGVCLFYRKGLQIWRPSIKLINIRLHLGCFKTEEEAAIVRDRAYVIRLFEEPTINNKEEKNNFINRCKNKLNLSEKDIEILKNHMTGLNNKDLTVL